MPKILLSLFIIISNLINPPLQNGLVRLGEDWDTVKGYFIDKYPDQRNLIEGTLDGLATATTWYTAGSAVEGVVRGISGGNTATQNIAVQNTQNRSLVITSNIDDSIQLRGYTKHGINQAISRDAGLGTSTNVILDTIKNPVKVIEQSNGARKVVGNSGSVVLNKDGRVITTYGQPRN